MTTTGTSLSATTNESEGTVKDNLPLLPQFNKSVVASLFLGFAVSISMGAAPLVAGADPTSLDFSLPQYDAKMQGFGDGKEAILNYRGRDDRTDPGANEKEKQADSMRKAEEARLAAKAQKRAAQKAAEEESKRRALEKKARDAERLQNIWN